MALYYPELDLDDDKRCKSCTWFAPLSPGHAAICFEKWRGLEWNAAVPLTTADDSCKKHEQRAPR